MRRCAPAVVVLSLPPAFENRDELIRKITGQSGSAPLVVLSKEAEPSIVVACLRSGAFDFIAKPYCLDQLRRSVGTAVAPVRETNKRDGPFVGGSSANQGGGEAHSPCTPTRPFPSSSSGESGTGKEVAARALHDLAPCKLEAFVARNCAAIPEYLVESELFRNREGRLHRCNRQARGLRARARRGSVPRRDRRAPLFPSKPSSCASSKAGNSGAWAAGRAWPWTFASSPRPAGTWAARLRKGLFAPISSIASIPSSSRCRRFARGAKT